MAKFGILAQFADPGSLMKAAEKVRDAGYKKFDCHSPFPIHGMDGAMGLKRTRLGYVIGVSAFLGAAGGFGLQWWTSTVGYPMIIAGKPFFSWQAFIVVTFGLMVLFGALSAVFGMFHFNRLPWLNHPLFESETFKQATDDGFFISIESDDPSFDEQKTTSLLQDIGASKIEVVEES
ncbi:MAG: DUF3341 domain-containing protein [FCB group bacterium]|nr:DUF3341 domain-containing protein [FCB group bacterium]